MNFPTTTMYEDDDDVETEAENLYDMKLITLKAVEPHTAPCLPWVESLFRFFCSPTVKVPIGSMYKIVTSIGVFRVFLKRSIIRCIIKGSIMQYRKRLQNNYENIVKTSKLQTVRRNFQDLY